MRLLPCPACGRHVRVADRDCRFCGALLTTAAPGLLSIALLGLSLVACDPGKTDEKKDPGKKDDAKTEAVEPPEPEPEPTNQPPEAEPEVEGTTTTTGAVEGTTSTTGTDEGATTGPVVEEPEPKPKPKYGAPRPTKKYGAPPKPPPDPDTF